MTKTIRCDIVSAHAEVFSGEAAMVFATGVAGELGITPRHAPLITQLKPGPVRVQEDTAMRGDDLDEAAAQAAKAEAERELADRTGEMEVAEAQAKLLEAIAQLQAMERLRKTLKH